ncbi:MAG: GDP-mannose 4,6-dehydratase [Pirellulales bacterium]
MTGHTGFKGAWLVQWLRRLEARVFGYALPPETTPNLFSAAAVGDLCEASTTGDVRNRETLAASIDAADPDVVFHLAAQPLVRRAYAEPEQTFDTNVRGTWNLLESLRHRRKPCIVVVVTSDKVYRVDGRTSGYRETDPLGGDDPYGASKAAAEIVVASYRSSFFPPSKPGEHGVAVASVRAGM